MPTGYSQAADRRDKDRPSGRNKAASDRIRSAVQVVGSVERALHPLPRSAEALLARVETNEVLGDLVLVVQMLRKAKAVAERAIDHVTGAAVGRLQVVTV